MKSIFNDDIIYSEEKIMTNEVNISNEYADEISIEDIESEEPLFEGEPQRYVAYLHQNKENGKIYVGYSKRVEIRWTQEEKNAFIENYHGYNYPFYRAIRKVGWDGFTHHILETFDNKQDALDAEMFWIEYFRTHRKKYGNEYGYNLTKGGDAPPDTTGSKRTPESVARMCEAQQKRTDVRFPNCHDDEHHLAISQASIGKEGTNSGKTFSQETKDRMSASMQGRVSHQKKFTDDEEKEIIEYYLGDISLTMTAVAKKFDCGKSVIRAILVRRNVIIRNSEKGKRKLSDEDYDKICELFDNGFRKVDIETSLKISNASVNRALERRELLAKEDGMTSYDKDKVIQSFNAGNHSITYLKEEFDLSGDAIRKILIDAGLDIFTISKGRDHSYTKSKLTKANEEMILDAFHNKTDTFNGLGRKTGTCGNTVRRFLQKQGLLA